MTPTVQWKNHLRGETAGPDHETQGTQAPTTNINMTNGQIPFQNPQRSVPNTAGPTVSGSMRYSQPPNNGPGKKASKLNNTQPSISAIFSRTSSYPQSRNLGTGHPKLLCTTCGEYDHWRKDCPYDCYCDNCDSDAHTTHMCRAPLKPSPTPSPQPVICIYCGSSDHRSMECSNHPRDNREEGHAPSPAPNRYNWERQQKSALASSEISQKSNGKSRYNDKPRTSDKNPHRPETGRQHHQGKYNQNSFPYRDYRYHEQLRQTRFNERQNQLYSPNHFAPSPALSAGSDLLSHSIMQLAETQSHSLEIFAAQQKSQIDVYQELTRSNKEKEHDALFTLIPVFDGDHTQCEQWLDDMDQATRISGCDLRTELIKKSTGVVRNVIMMAHPDESDDDLINMIRDFSDAPTMNEAQEELLHMHQKPEEQMRVYVYRYGCMHQRSSGIRAADETHQHVIQDFVKSLKPKIKNKFANKFAACSFQPRTLEQEFSLALDLEKKIQIADSFRDDIMDSRTPATVNEVQSFPLDESRSINEVSSYRNNNSNSHGRNNYSGKPWQQKNNSKPWQNKDNKWQNRDNKSWQNKDIKSWQYNKSKGDKPHDTCFTLSQDQKFFVPADCDENVFQIICTLVKAQIDKAKQSGGNGKEINEISKDTLVNLLNISGETYDAAQSAVQEVEKGKISSSSSSTD